ncbi:MAG: ACT domain-containing protein, partial [Celeribacter marinus]
MSSHVLTVTCKSTRGIVAAISGKLAELGCNITDSAQFDDPATAQFFMRVSFVSETGLTDAQIAEGFAAVADAFDMQWAIHDEAKKMKVVVMVSRFGHCLNDLLYRVR